ncbi:MAG: hypothetical protein DID91_2727703967 [Candidatus Nitrotoga sp. MKT]|nr:MAG: hypothetical protein DID91_2727703967 [Candidatus Nitrotoga sp. MKT]
MNSMEEKKRRTLGRSRHFGLDLKDGVRVSEKELNQFIERMTGLSRQQVANQERMV